MNEKDKNGKDVMTGEALFPPYVVGYEWSGGGRLIQVLCPGCGGRHFYSAYGWHQPNCEAHHAIPLSLARPAGAEPRLLIGCYYVLRAAEYLKLCQARFGDS
jgi:hypothetical protein